VLLVVLVRPKSHHWTQDGKAIEEGVKADDKSQVAPRKSSTGGGRRRYGVGKDVGRTFPKLRFPSEAHTTRDGWVPKNHQQYERNR
jgi:hypothetical protein